ncbi:hypothetical protein OF83DRAFT_451307 [Amylostereum chailletii]|nr:hypothetical protein OF83DRAFT_451307 [Amylostereum chailletii]
MLSSHSLLLALPTELLLKILDTVDLNALLACQKVCRKLYGMVRDASELQHRLLLCARGLRDRLPWQDGCTPAERAVRVDENARRWRTLTCARSAVVAVECRANTEVLMSAGVLAFRTGGTVTLRRLACERLGVEGKETWAVEVDVPEGWKVAGWAMDPEQDLLAMVRSRSLDQSACLVTVVCLALSTGKRHPLADGAGVLEGRLAKDPHPDFTTSISNDHIAVLCSGLWGHEDELRVWNWKTGATELDLKAKGLDGFVFLDDAHVVVSRAHQSTNNAPLAQSAHLAIHALRLGDSAPAPPVRLVLPAVSSLDDTNVSLRMAASAYEPDVPETRVLALEMSLKWPSFGSARLVRVLVDLAQIKRFLAGPRGTDADDTNADSEVPWEDWGPDASRVLAVEDAWSAHYVRTAVAGARCVLPLWSRGRALKTVDTHPARLLAARAAKPTAERWEIVSTASTVGIPWTNCIPATTRLAYVETEIATPAPLDNLDLAGTEVLVGEDHLVAVQRPGTGWMHVHVYDF